MAKPEPRWPDALNRVIAERNQARAAIERVRSLHWLRAASAGMPETCGACFMVWPCPTREALEED